MAKCALRSCLFVLVLLLNVARIHGAAEQCEAMFCLEPSGDKSLGMLRWLNQGNNYDNNVATHFTSLRNETFGEVGVDAVTVEIPFKSSAPNVNETFLVSGLTTRTMVNEAEGQYTYDGGASHELFITVVAFPLCTTTPIDSIKIGGSSGGRADMSFYYVVDKNGLHYAGSMAYPAGNTKTADSDMHTVYKNASFGTGINRYFYALCYLNDGNGAYSDWMFDWQLDDGSARTYIPMYNFNSPAVVMGSAFSPTRVKVEYLNGRSNAPGDYYDLSTGTLLGTGPVAGGPGIYDINISTCSSLDCNMPTLANGQVTGSSNYEQYVNFTCDTGYFLVGNASSQCTLLGIDLPTCKRICSVPVLGNGSSTYVSGTITSGSPIEDAAYTLTCNSGFSLVPDHSSVVCGSSGTFNSSGAACVQECDMPTVGNGSVAFTSGLNGTNGKPLENSTITYACDSYFFLNATATATCAGGAFSGSQSFTTLCVRTCPMPAPPSDGTVAFSAGQQQNTSDPSSDLLAGSTVTYSCSAGYFLAGSATSTCQSDGAYTGSATCTRSLLTVCS